MPGSCFFFVLPVFDGRIMRQCAALFHPLDLRAQVQKQFRQNRVEVLPAAVSDDFKTLIQRERRAIAPIRRDCVEYIRYGHYSGTEWDLLALQPLRISRSVPFLVVIPGNLRGHFQILFVAHAAKTLLNDFRALGGVAFDLFKLLRRQLSRLL